MVPKRTSPQNFSVCNVMWRFPQLLNGKVEEHFEILEQRQKFLAEIRKVLNKSVISNKQTYNKVLE